MDPECNNDVDVPSSAVIHDTFGLTISTANTVGAICVTQVQKDPLGGGGLVAGGDDEDVWAWNNGEKWGDELPVDEDDD